MYEDEDPFEEARHGDDNDSYAVCNTPSSMAATVVDEATGVRSFIKFPAHHDIKPAALADTHVPHVLAPASRANRPLPRVLNSMPSWVSASEVDTAGPTYSWTPLADVIPIPKLPRGAIFYEADCNFKADVPLTDALEAEDVVAINGQTIGWPLERTLAPIDHSHYEHPPFFAATDMTAVAVGTKGNGTLAGWLCGRLPPPARWIGRKGGYRDAR